jgi:hypothetical protein
MLRELLIVTVGVSVLAASASRVRAATLFARSFPLTGEVRLENPGSSPVPIVFYSIKSTAGALNPSPTRWVSITEHYDAPIAPSPGNGLVDPNGIWTKISSLATELAEGALDVDGGHIPANRAISLGRIWNPSVPFDLSFAATEPNGQPISIFPTSGLDGDYDGSRTVDQLDYLRWRAAHGTVSLAADGNLNGIVDAADYAVWRNNLGLSISGSGAALPALVGGATIPEPTAEVLVGGALCAFGAWRNRLRHRFRVHRR